MLNRLFLTTALTSLMFGAASLASAQTTIDADRDTPITTEDAGDITVNVGSTISTTTEGPAITINSDNTVTQSGVVNISDIDNATGVLISGGNTGGYTQSGAIGIVEDYTPEDTDGDRIPDQPLALGTGRTGILISGASPFVGNVTLEEAGSITVEGNDSYGIRLAGMSGLTGDLNALGSISVTGDNSVGVSIEDRIIGELALGRGIATRGTGASSVVVSGDVDGGFTATGAITNTGYRFTDRPNVQARPLLDEDDLGQAGAAINISSNIRDGILFDQVVTTTTAEDGTVTSAVTSIASVTQLGGAPAILIDGQGTPIAIGRVSAITDPDAEGFDANLLYAFINEGQLVAQGVYNDVNSTTFEVRDATLEGGFFNSGTMSASSFRSGDDGTADVEGFTGTSKVLVFGDGAISEAINNTGVITANVREADDEVYADRDNIVAPRFIEVVAIDIESDADVGSLINSGAIGAVLTGRNGNVVAIRDASGTLSNIVNTGTISAFGLNSDANGNEETDFMRTALGLSANTSGVSIVQNRAVDTDETDEFTPPNPSINGDIRLGDGDDVVTLTAGSVIGAIDFAGGDNTLSLSGDSFVVGAITSDGGTIGLDVANSSLTNLSGTPLSVRTASFDATSSYNPTLDGATGNASTLVGSGDITFADGAQINPVLSNIIGSTTNTFTVASSATNLNIEGDISALSGAVSPFLYNTSYAIDPSDPNALIVTLDLRETSELGLDNVQTSAFNSAFEALGANAALGDAFVNITDGTEFNQAFNQLLPEFAAAARQFVIANVDGATGAVGAHLDNVRRSQDRPGGAWIQEFAYFADRDLAGLSEQYRGSGFGFSAGLDTELGPFHAVGITAGFASTEIESVADIDEPFDMVTVQLGAYAGYETGNLGIEAIAGIGYNDFESQRRVSVGNFIGDSSGDWSGTHINASLRAGYDYDISDRFFVRPAVSLDYLTLKENAYTEDGLAGIALEIDERTSDSGSATAMLNFGGKFMGKRTWIRPSVRVGYRNDFINDGVITTGRFVGGTTPFTIESEEFPDSGFLLGFSVAAGSEFSSFSLDVDSDIRDGFIRHTGRIVLRLLF